LPPPAPPPSLDASGDGLALLEAGADALPDCGADTGTSLDHCGACFAACPAGSTACVAGRCQATLRIRVGIDGQSVFRFSGAEAYWHQVLYAAPARHKDAPLPLQMNGATFNPSWPDAAGDTTNYSCNCDSSKMTVPAPPLPKRAQTVGLQVVTARKSITIAEQPSAANGHRLSVLFDDVGFGGSEYYEAVLSYESR
jgi:hypothetical protein